VYWILAGEYDLKLISGTCLAPFANKPFSVVVLKFISMLDALLDLEMQHQMFCSI